MKSTILTSVTVLLLIGLLIIGGCSSNKPQVTTDDKSKTGDQELTEIDQLFGISEKEKQPEQSTDEAEVLELLGIKKDKTETATPMQPAAQNEDQLKNEISELEQKLAEKDSEISNLKSDLTVKEDKISTLETSGTRQIPPASAGYTATGNFREDYQAALSEYNSRNYKVAIQMFEDLLSRNAANSLSDNCRYWIGESYYGLGNFNQAIIEFTKVFSFNKSNKADAAQLKLGLCYWRLGDRERAKQEFERLISDYPKSEYVEKAQQFISKL